MTTALLVDGASYLTAAETFVAGNRLAASCFSSLATSLRATGAMAGTDSTSASFAAAYDEAASSLVRGCADVVASYASLARLTAASVENHARADLTPLAPYADAPVRVHVPSLPSALGGSGASPPHLWDLVEAHLEGFAWPNASCPSLRAAASVWRSASRDLALLPHYLDRAADELAASRSPELPTAYEVIHTLRTSIWTLADGARSLADACEDYAEQVEQHRAVVVDVLHDLAVQAGISLVAGGLLSAVTAGGGMAAGGALAGWRATAAARRILETLRALRDLARAGAVARLTAVTDDLAPLRVLLGRLAEFSEVREAEVVVWRLPGKPLDPATRPAAAGEDWFGVVAHNGRGDVWQSPAASHEGGDIIRVMDPDGDYPYGYVRFHNEHGQAVGLDGKPHVPGGTKKDDREHTHIPINPDGTYPTPEGWDP